MMVKVVIDLSPVVLIVQLRDLLRQAVNQLGRLWRSPPPQGESPQEGSRDGAKR